MPRTNLYTPFKRTMMQVTMWCVFLAAVGAAALVDRQLSPMSSMALGREETNGLLQFRLPVGWMIEPGTDRSVAAVAVDPVNPSPIGPARTLVIYHRRGVTLTRAADYLQASGLMEEIFGSNGAGPDQIEHTTLAGSPAILLRGQSEVTTNGATVIESDIVICCIFPNHHAVTLWLAKLGPVGASDLTLFAEVAHSVKMAQQPIVEPN
jgi:hypothetical protein